MKWTYVTISNDGNEFFVPDDDLRVFDTQRLAFNHAYSTANSEADELRTGKQDHCPAADRCRLYPLLAGGGSGPVCPARRHSGRVLSADGAAGPLRIL